MQEISRKSAVQLLEEIAEMAAAEFERASSSTAQPTKPADWAFNVKAKLARYGLELPKPCTGEAHSNAFIDNCGVCMPRWGWVFTGNGYRIP